MKGGDGRTRATAYRVKSVDEEYEILRLFGLRPASQSLIIGNDQKPYDMLDATNPKSGDHFELWFDISLVPSLF